MNIKTVLKTNISRLYNGEELDEVILIWYKLVNWAISEDADKIIVSESAISWLYQQNTLGQLKLFVQPLDRSYAETLDYILGKDEFLQGLIKKVGAESTSITYALDTHKIQTLKDQL